MNNDILPFPYIPSEIFLQILEATHPHKPTLLTLSLVSSWVREIAYPLLINTITLTTASQVSAFLRIVPTRSPDWWKGHLKNLWVTYPDPSRRCSQIFRLVQKPTRLAFQSSILHWQEDPEYLLAHLLQRCSELTLIGPTFPYNFANAAHAFASLTHLHLTEPLSGPAYTGRKIAELPKLTHIALPFQQPRGYAGDDFEEIKYLLESQTLQMVVLHMKPKTWSKNCSGASDIHRSLTEWKIAAWEYDLRLHVMEASKWESKDWQEAIGGSGCIWRKAAQERMEVHLRLHGRSASAPPWQKMN